MDLWLLIAACSAPAAEEKVSGSLLAATNVLCELYRGQSACSTITQEHYPTQEGVDSTTLASLAMSGNLVCGIETSGAVACGGFDQYGLLNEPDGSYKAVATGNSHACVLESDGTPVCWGADYAYALDAPTGVSLDSLIAGDNRTCGYSEATETWSCWGADRNWLEHVGVVMDVPPDGAVITSLSMYGIELFGITADGTVGRWGWPLDATVQMMSTGLEDIPSGAGYTKVDVGTWHACALHESGRIDCWGDNTFGQQDVPAGTWSDVAAGETFTCGRRTTGELACWGCSGTCYRAEPPIP